MEDQTEPKEATAEDETQAEAAEEGTPQRGVFIALVVDEAGEEVLNLHPVNLDPLGVPTVIAMAAKLVKQNLDL